MSRRTERVAELLRGEIARLLREDASDPRLAGVTLTRVDVAPDLSQALVFWSVLAEDAETQQTVQTGLESAASFLRSRLARELSLRRTPRLGFRHDPSLARGADTLALLRELADESET